MCSLPIHDGSVSLLDAAGHSSRGQAPIPNRGSGAILRARSTSTMSQPRRRSTRGIPPLSSSVRQLDHGRPDQQAKLTRGRVWSDVGSVDDDGD